MLPSSSIEVHNMLLDSGAMYSGSVALTESGAATPHGHGIKVWPNGTTWIGQFTDGKISGKGEMKNNSPVARYCGRVRAETMSVHDTCATCTWENGDTYTGGFKDGALDGFGTYTWKLEAAGGRAALVPKKYCGPWVNGVSQGAGCEYQWPGGWLFKGKFHAGSPTDGIISLNGGLSVAVHGGVDALRQRLPPNNRWKPTPASAISAGLAAALDDRQFWANAKRIEAVAPGTDEFDAVRLLVAESSHGSPPWTVCAVERIENAHRLEMFAAARKHVKSTAEPPWEPEHMERWLFHSPGAIRNGDDDCIGDVVMSIAEDGFRPLLAGKRTGAAFGVGTYFARDSFLADHYSSEIGCGLRTVIVARVVVGECALGRHGMLAPPRMPDGSGRRYHTLVDVLGDPSIFVVQESANAYPAYVVRYRIPYDKVVKASSIDRSNKPSHSLARSELYAEGEQIVRDMLQYRVAEDDDGRGVGGDHSAKKNGKRKRSSGAEQP